MGVWWLSRSQYGSCTENEAEQNPAKQAGARAEDRACYRCLLRVWLGLARSTHGHPTSLKQSVLSLAIKRF